MNQKPNILLILTDQQNAGMASCYGNPYLSTPAIDSLANRGMRFNRAYCTNPVCIPSRFSLMTGRMPSAIGLRNNETDALPPIPGEITGSGLGHLLREAGYRTFYGGKQHFPNTSAEELGFEYFENDERDGLANSCEQFLKKPPPAPWAMVASFINPHDICYMAIRDFPDGDYSSRLLKTATSELQALDQALNMPSEFDDPPLPHNHEPQKDEPAAVDAIRKQRAFKIKAATLWGEQRWRAHRRAYARLTEMVDAQIGRVLDALDSGGQGENTVVVFTSDHGDMDGSHRLEHKTAFYEECCRVPLVIRWNDHAAPGAVSDALVSNGLDLTPTLCEVAGRPVPGELKGRSLVPLLEGRDGKKWREFIPIESEFGRAVWTQRYAYVRYNMPGNHEQIYDLEHDPGQMRNALKEDGHRKAKEKFRELFPSSSPSAGEGTGR